ncbi:hypothetical protein [Dechloromonas denitrificans]|uniref:hypothetical protein n=1 Tax=Dechloromonas denitrificans TaxID=281362 RepID=UPI001CFBBA42|nr:hypothetical protein [Dechloromonas denitrificans]UCV08476.1 hypothetical protein KI615_02790 [Dechloromonas denitrificans]
MIANATARLPNEAPAIFAQDKIVAPCEIATTQPESLVIRAPAQFDSGIAERVREWQWKLSILAPAIEQPKKSRARGAIIDEMAKRSHVGRNGEPVTLSSRTLRRWLGEVDRDDLPALARKRRADRQGRRCLISRTWDDACPLPETEKARIAADLEGYVRSLWANGAPGVNRIEAFASSKLVELCRVAGWPEATQNNCTVGRYLVERHRDVSLVAIKERNAKHFFDHYTPRIKRNREGLKPMDVVIGDVHPLDVIKAHDGREVHARLIAWLDLATYDIHVTVVILDKGRGIRQEDIARSFVAMALEWGLPRCLYLDNGSEYKWAEMMNGFQALTGLTHAFEVFIKSAAEVEELVDYDAAPTSPEARAIIRARPYNAPAKQIEGVFGILERGYFSLMPGWIGGDRMKKRTHKVGAAPRAYEGETEEFERDLDTCLDLYRSTPQADGSSPNDKRRAYYGQGWQPIKAAREVFLFAFSEVRRLKVHAGGIQVDGTWGMADALIPMIGKTVDIRVAKWDRSHSFYIDANGKLHAIPMGDSFNHGDVAGAKEQMHRARILNEHIRDLKAGTKRLDIVAEARRHVAAQPPAPELPEGMTIDLEGQGEAVSTALANVGKRQPRLPPGALRNPNTGVVMNIPPPKEKGPNDAPTSFDPMQALLAIPDKKEKPNPETPAFDLVKHLSANNRKA